MSENPVNPENILAACRTAEQQQQTEARAAGDACRRELADEAAHAAEIMQKLDFADLGGVVAIAQDLTMVEGGQLARAYALAAQSIIRRHCRHEAARMKAAAGQWAKLQPQAAQAAEFEARRIVAKLAESKGILAAAAELVATADSGKYPVYAELCRFARQSPAVLLADAEEFGTQGSRIAVGPRWAHLQAALRQARLPLHWLFMEEGLSPADLPEEFNELCG